MKKTTFIFWLLLTFLSVSCKRDSSRYIIGVSQCSDDEWRHKMNNEILREAQFYNGLRVEIRTAGDNNKKQKEDIQYFIDKKVDLLIVSPNEAAPITPVVEEAYSKGIPVIVVDRKILSDKYTAYIGADNFEIGKAVGNYIATQFKGKGTIVELTGLSGSTPAIDRHLGFISAIGKYPSLSLLCKEDAGWLQHQAEEKMDSILKQYPQIDVVFAQNDRMASGAYLAARKHHREKEMAFIGIDALPGTDFGVDLVLKDVLDATFIYPTGGYRVIQIAMRILEGKEYPRETILSTAIVNKTNAGVMKLQTDQIAENEKRIGLLNTRIGDYLANHAKQKIVMYASFIVLLLFAGMLLIVWLSLRVKNRLNKELSQRNNEITTQKEELELKRDQLIGLSKQLEEATNAKLVFFTNVSHDFRTPLTLVADPVDQLLKDKDLTNNQRQSLQLIKKNVNILLRLVNQILDFRTYESGKLKLVVSRVDLAVSLEEWNSAFRDVIRKKHLKFHFNVMPERDFYAVVDVEKLERVYFNLLANAMKFTPENGEIHVNLLMCEQDGKTTIRFTVANSGSVISSEHIRNIFDRFYKIEMHHGGSGIGLALAKAFVDMHGGVIQVDSDERNGTVFTVEIPLNRALLNEEAPDLVPAPVIQPQVSDYTDEEFTDAVQSESRELILIIDDNADIRCYIRQLLQQNYAVIEARNGIEGIRKAMKYIPDLIISDVMMPEIDGIECCRRLKKELQTCHIPIILLTACSLDEQRIEGFENGADSYISKPFSSQVLLARVRNLMEGRKRLKQFFGDTNMLDKEPICDMDKIFVDKFKKLIEEGIGNAELNVEDLGREMGLSRVQLYRKLKSLTNYAPNELLRIARLKKASFLISSSDKTIAEICYEVGFTSPSYFSKCYKDYFGENPSEYIKRTGI